MVLKSEDVVILRYQNVRISACQAIKILRCQNGVNEPG